MILETYRPKTIEDAVQLLLREDIETMPLGGGTFIKKITDRDFNVVDLGALSLNRIEKQGKNLIIGATATLQELKNYPDCPEALVDAIECDPNISIQQKATIGGAIVVADGRSSFATILLAMDGIVHIEPQSAVHMGDFLPMRKDVLRGRLITAIEIPLNVRVSLQYVKHKNNDYPIISAAIAIWNSGRTRLAFGGFGRLPVLAMDGPISDGVFPALRNALYDAEDDRAPAKTRMELGRKLVERCLEITRT